LDADPDWNFYFHVDSYLHSAHYFDPHGNSNLNGYIPDHFLHGFVDAHADLFIYGGS
jgi:hypothetical protein